MALALFDLDHTLLAGDSDYAWGQFLIARGLVDGATHQRENDSYFAQYQAGTLDIMAFLAFALAPLARLPRAQLDALHVEFMQERIVPMITPMARALVEYHRDQGDTPIIITSTNSFVTAPIARAFGVAHLLATEPEILDGCFTGHAAGVPCFQDGKVVRLREWLADRDETMAGAHAYSDSHNDLPLLSLVDHPVAVDPDNVLRAHAKAHGWPIISLR